MKKLLALNRGEIAIRILRAANELGLRTVAVTTSYPRAELGEADVVIDSLDELTPAMADALVV